MSRKRFKDTAARRAAIFAALGDETRLLLVAKLSARQPYSISQLTEDFPVTRQAITKHLRVLEDVGIVRCKRTGRTRLFEYDPRPVEELKRYLDFVSEQWDHALSRLKSFVER